ncbi:hypothetical protein J2755_002124 [Methanohalophilus levihalophilus]|nr:hypothetical protein [Methanohalophilus levihalophilus]
MSIESNQLVASNKIKLSIAINITFYNSKKTDSTVLNHTDVFKVFVKIMYFDRLILNNKK